MATDAEVDSIESQLWIVFPPGYREFVTRLGEGIVGDSFVRIYPPWRIEAELDGWRKRIKKYWFWDDGSDLLPKERGLECVIVGDTIQGDELVFHPRHPQRLFVLPRESEQVFEAGADLLTAVEWMLTSDELTEPIDGRDFEPFDSRKEETEEETDSDTAADPEGESMDELIELGQQWAKRYGAIESAKELLQEQRPFKRLSDPEVQLASESLVLDGEFPIQPGYSVTFNVLDGPSKLLVGKFLWSTTLDSYSYQYTPDREGLKKLKEKRGEG